MVMWMAQWLTTMKMILHNCYSHIVVNIYERLEFIEFHATGKHLKNVQNTHWPGLCTNCDITIFDSLHCTCTDSWFYDEQGVRPHFAETSEFLEKRTLMMRKSKTRTSKSLRMGGRHQSRYALCTSAYNTWLRVCRTSDDNVGTWLNWVSSNRYPVSLCTHFSRPAQVEFLRISFTGCFTAPNGVRKCILVSNFTKHKTISIASSNTSSSSSLDHWKIYSLFSLYLSLFAYCLRLVDSIDSCRCAVEDISQIRNIVRIHSRMEWHFICFVHKLHPYTYRTYVFNDRYECI